MQSNSFRYECRARHAAFVALLLACAAVPAAAQRSVLIEELTWTEVRDAVASGTTTIIIPTGGTEQNGPHMILGKHNIIVKYTTGEMARQLGNALVAPVVTYVPEGDVDPRSFHMRFPGTITLPDEYFRKLLEFAARSFKAHGFTDIVFIGDSGGNQPGAKAVADTLSKEWAASPVRVHTVEEYYANTAFTDWLRDQGETTESIGVHAGIRDTSELMALFPQGVRNDKRAVGKNNDGSGVAGDPRRANVGYGKKGLELKIATGVRLIRELRVSSRK